MDHLRSYVYGLGESLIAGKELDYAALSGSYSSELESIYSELARSALSDELREELNKFIKATRLLLKQISKAKSH
ncbi:MAG: hypothetical protein ACRD9R_20580 [Pyrinomonadaceae bacterium]